MNTTIDLPNQIYEQLAKQAQARGATLAETVAQVLEEAEASQLSSCAPQACCCPNSLCRPATNGFTNASRCKANLFLNA